MPRIGLVLGGGGITGTAFHAGVLTALAQQGWDARDAEVIVGTSAGSTSAALLRAGFPPAEYLNRVSGRPVSAEAARVLDRIGSIPQPPRRRRGPLRPASPRLLRAVVGNPLRFPLGVALAALLPTGTISVDEVNPGFGPLFEEWPQRPMWITAVNLGSGQRTVFGRDAVTTVPLAVSASCAIPGYFSPIDIDGERYVDGGAHSVCNLDLLAGPLPDGPPLDLILVSAPLSTTDPFALELGNIPRSPLRRQLDREIAAVTRHGTPVVVFQPDSHLRHLMGLNSMDLAKRPAVGLAACELAARVIREHLSG